MPKRKRDKYGQINRNYTIKCPACGEQIYVTEEEPWCQMCEAGICPDCLMLLKDNTTDHSGSNSNGSWANVTCNNCGFDVVDTDV